VPLPTLLSQILVALTISLDNEFEHRMPHTTTMGKKRGLGTPGPWLVSWPMWANFMRYVSPDGVRLGDLRQQPGVGASALEGTNPGMVRWGYVTLAVPPGAPEQRSRLEDMVVRQTQAGQRAQAIWEELRSACEPNWREAFGSSNLDSLQHALIGILDQVDTELPRYITPLVAPSEPRQTPVDDLDLTALLSQVLMLFTIDYERDAGDPLFMAANVLRVVGHDGTPTRDLPRRSGISKEAINLMIGPLHKGRLVNVEPDTTTPRQKLARLTPAGAAAKAIYERLPGAIEKAWTTRFGDRVAALRAAAEAVVGGSDLATSPLGAVIQPHPDGWRSWVKPPDTLPHHPQPNHRGGYPDGA
jgi:DNA-binding MarR family transcriptional regulator